MSTHETVTTRFIGGPMDGKALDFPFNQLPSDYVADATTAATTAQRPPVTRPRGLVSYQLQNWRRESSSYYFYVLEGMDAAEVERIALRHHMNEFDEIVLGVVRAITGSRRRSVALSDVVIDVNASSLDCLRSLMRLVEAGKVKEVANTSGFKFELVKENGPVSHRDLPIKHGSRPSWC